MSGTRGFVIKAMTQAVREVNEANGWHEQDKPRTVGEDCALLHSEITEAFEAWRHHGFADQTDHPDDGCEQHGEFPPKPEGWGSELADVLIRLLDTADRTGVDLAAEFDRKLAYNRTRGYRHGGLPV